MEFPEKMVPRQEGTIEIKVSLKELELLSAAIKMRVNSMYMSIDKIDCPEAAEIKEYLLLRKYIKDTIRHNYPELIGDVHKRKEQEHADMIMKALFEKPKDDRYITQAREKTREILHDPEQKDVWHKKYIKTRKEKKTDCGSFASFLFSTFMEQYKQACEQKSN